MVDQPPLWLDDLLNEPETPVRRGDHRRSSSDTFAYFNMASSGFTQDKNMLSVPSWGVFQGFQPHGGLWYQSPFPQTSHGKQKNKSMESSSSASGHCPSRSIVEDSLRIRSNRPSCAGHLEGDGGSSISNERQKNAERAANAPKAASKSKDTAHGKGSSPDVDNKRAKQQFAQRSRVRKLQYIAELERNMQALQAEGWEMSAEIDFLSQQHMILSMENKSLRQHLENLSQEQLIKIFEHDILESKVSRLRGLYQQQQLQEPSSGHKRSSSKDLNLEFSNLSLKH